MSKYMRVAFFTHHFLEPTHHSISQILEGLIGCKFTVFAKRFEDEKHFRLSNVTSRYSYIKGPLPLLNRENFDLTHAIFDGKTALRAGALAKKAGLPYLLSFHGGFDTQAKIFDPRYTERTREIVDGADAVTVICAADETRLRKIGVTRPVEIIPVPIDLSLIPNLKRSNPHHLVTIGRFIPKKGLDVALLALKNLPKEYFLTIIGDGELQNDLKCFSKSLGIQERVFWKGLLPLDKTLDVMSSANILLHPARIASDGNAEGTPQTILWAQAMGLPVISTPTGSICEIVEDKVTGLLVQEESSEALAKAILYLDNENGLREKITRNGMTNVFDNHSSEQIIAKYHNIYKRLVYGC